VTNPGNVSLHNVAVQDLHPLSSIALLVVGMPTLITCRGYWNLDFYRSDTVTQADIDAGKLNQASVDGFALTKQKYLTYLVVLKLTMMQMYWLYVHTIYYYN
jgi:hypothetical protein